MAVCPLMLHKDAQQSDCCSQLRIRISYGQSGLTPHQAPAFFKAAAIRCAAFAVWNEHFLGHGSFPLCQVLSISAAKMRMLRLRELPTGRYISAPGR